MIQLSEVSKWYGSIRALASTDLMLDSGRSLALIGPSGCGKSTLLRIALGLVTPDSGRVVIAGLELSARTVEAVRHRVGMVLQDGGLFPHLTAAQNVALLPLHLGWSREKVAERTELLCDLTALPRESLDRYPLQLSGGQRQRVALMRALMLDPGVLLLDEPLSALDPIVRAGLQEDLQRIFTMLGKTVLLVTHDMAEAAFLGNEIALMRAGEILQRGSAEALLERPADPFVAQFIRAQRSAWPPVASAASSGAEAG